MKRETNLKESIMRLPACISNNLLFILWYLTYYSFIHWNVSIWYRFGTDNHERERIIFLSDWNWNRYVFIHKSCWYLLYPSHVTYLGKSRVCRSKWAKKESTFFCSRNFCSGNFLQVKFKMENIFFVLQICEASSRSITLVGAHLHIIFYPV